MKDNWKGLNIFYVLTVSCFLSIIALAINLKNDISIYTLRRYMIPLTIFIGTMGYSIYLIIKNLKLGKTISNIAFSFLKIDNMDNAINEAFNKILELFSFERGHLFFLDKEGLRVIDHKQWQGQSKDNWALEQENEYIYFNKEIMDQLRSNQIAFIKQGKMLKLLLPVYVGEVLESIIMLESKKTTTLLIRPKLFFLSVFAEILGDAQERKVIYDILREKESTFDSLFEKSLNPIIIMDGQLNYIDANISTLNFFETSIERFLEKKINNGNIKEMVREWNYREDFFNTPKTIEVDFTIKDTIKTLVMNMIPIRVNKKNFIYCIGHDITKLKQLKQDLKQSQQYYQSLFQYNMDAVFAVDLEGKFTTINPMAQKISGYSIEELVGKSFVDMLKEVDKEQFIKDFGKVLAGEPQHTIATIYGKRGNRVDISLMAIPIVIEDKIIGAFGIAEDITYTKAIENKLKHISYHDNLTSLYNRVFFEQQLESIRQHGYSSIAIMICDIDGLKLINDSLGHHMGDRLLISAAQCISKPLDHNSICARIGGDEFAVLIKEDNVEDIVRYHEEIKTNVEQHNRLNPHLPLNLSIGYSISKYPSIPIEDVYKEADNNMYRQKLNATTSARSEIVNALVKILEERDTVTKEHAKRVEVLVVKLAAKLGFSDDSIEKLKLLAQFHDIGKIGIPDRILKKPGRLTPEEYREMKLHCEVGYRIVQSVPSLNLIDELVLKHHEWWNGQGYPLGLKGEEIPIECRLFAIVDSYDVITSKRPYKEALSHQEAIEEIKKCASTQFDPVLVQHFIEVIDKEQEEQKEQVY